MTIYLVFNKTPCIYERIPWDDPGGESLFMCVDQAPGLSGLALLAIFPIIFLYEVLLGFMFVYKLHKALKSMEQHTMRFKETIIKNTILYVATLTSTLTFYVIWFLDIFNVLFILHFDALINCAMIALMYHYNEKYYQCLCGVCSRYCTELYSRRTLSSRSIRVKSVASKTDWETHTPPPPITPNVSNIRTLQLTPNTPTVPMTTPKSLSPEKSVCGFIINYHDEEMDDEEP